MDARKGVQGEGFTTGTPLSIDKATRTRLVDINGREFEKGQTVKWDGNTGTVMALVGGVMCVIGSVDDDGVETVTEMDGPDLELNRVEILESSRDLEEEESESEEACWSGCTIT
mmetsp:Transcript_37560/g.67397  ORF Transcript_37560/g.67397 Transcript_37560/m.67397 type:complete len:114 (+) Transcript_37560:66-407(+)